MRCGAKIFAPQSAQRLDFCRQILFCSF